MVEYPSRCDVLPSYDETLRVDSNARVFYSSLETNSYDERTDILRYMIWNRRKEHNIQQEAIRCWSVQMDDV